MAPQERSDNIERSHRSEATMFSEVRMPEQRRAGQLVFHKTEMKRVRVRMRERESECVCVFVCVCVCVCERERERERERESHRHLLSGSENQTKKTELPLMRIEPMVFGLALRRPYHSATESPHLNHKIQLGYHFS